MGAACSTVSKPGRGSPPTRCVGESSVTSPGACLRAASAHGRARHRPDPRSLERLEHSRDGRVAESLPAANRSDESRLGVSSRCGSQAHDSSRSRGRLASPPLAFLSPGRRRYGTCNPAISRMGALLPAGERRHGQRSKGTTDSLQEESGGPVRVLQNLKGPPCLRASPQDWHGLQQAGQSSSSVTQHLRRPASPTRSRARPWPEPDRRRSRRGEGRRPPGPCRSRRPPEHPAAPIPDRE